MRDSFSKTLTINVEKGRVWAAAEVLWAVCSRLASENESGFHISLSGRTLDSRGFRRRDLGALREAFESVDATPASVDWFFHLKGDSEEPSPLSYVSGTAWFHMYPWVRLTASGSSRLAMEASVGRLRRDLEAALQPAGFDPTEIKIGRTEISSYDEEADLLKGIEERRTQSPSEIVSTPTLSPEPTDEPHTPESTKDWWRRTWRDHTAALIVGVVATIGAAALLVLLGISSL